MKKVMLSTAAVAVVAAISLAGYASAQGGGMEPQNGTGYGGGRQASLDSRAAALGVSSEDLQKAIDAGKTMYDVAKEQGLSLKQFQATMREAAKARWEARGLSDEEIQKRVDWQTERQADCDGTGTHRGGGGYGRQNRA